MEAIEKAMIVFNVNEEMASMNLNGRKRIHVVSSKI